MKIGTLFLSLAVCLASSTFLSKLAVSQATVADTEPAAADDSEAVADAKTGKAQQNGAAEPSQVAKGDAPTKDARDSQSPTDDANSKARPTEKKKQQTVKVKSEHVSIVATLDGTFAAKHLNPIVLRPEEWSQFEIVEVIPHGTEVHAGQSLIKFDSEKFDEAIADLELELHLSELAIRKAEEELPRLEKSLALAADEAERTDKNAHEDYDRYFKTDRPLLLKSVDYSLKAAQFQLDYQQDELDQLEKMYAADDLTEETEEIVLKRSRTSVDFAKFNLEQTKLYCDEMLNIRLPRLDIRINESLNKAALSLAQAKSALAINLTRARYDLEKQKKTRARSLNRHAKLLADRALFELKAPTAGMVYYGECEVGKWSDMSSMLSKLKPFNNVSANTVLMTIVERRPLEVLAQVGESQRPEFSVGQSAKVVTPLENAAWLPAKLESISVAPVANGKFNAQFAFVGAELPDWIVAGMNCKVKVVIYDKEEALVLPKKAVHTDKHNEEQKYVWLVVGPQKPEAKPERRNVKLGKSSGDLVEVREGLKEGDVVSLEDEKKPAQQTAE